MDEDTKTVAPATKESTKLNKRQPPALAVLAACCIIQFSAVAYPYSFGIYQAEYSLRVFPDQKASVISFIGSLSFATSLVSSIPAGRLIELYGPRPTATIGSICFCASWTGASFCHTVPQLIVTQGILGGLANGLFYMPAATAFLPYFTRRRSLAVGLTGASICLGALAWSFITQALIDSLGWRWSLRVAALLGSCSTLCSVPFLGPPISKTRHSSSKTLARIVQLFGNTRYLLLYVGSLVALFGYLVPLTYLATYIRTKSGGTAKQGSTIIAILNLGGFAGRISLGILADTAIGPFNAYTIAFVLSAIAPFALWLPADGHIGIAYAFSFWFGFTAFGWLGMIASVLVKLIDAPDVPLALAVFISNEFAGTLAATFVAGSIIDAQNGDYLAAKLFTGAALLFGACLIVFARYLHYKKVKLDSVP